MNFRYNMSKTLLTFEYVCDIMTMFQVRILFALDVTKNILFYRNT